MPSRNIGKRWTREEQSLHRWSGQSQHSDFSLIWVSSDFRGGRLPGLTPVARLRRYEPNWGKPHRWSTGLTSRQSAPPEVPIPFQYRNRDFQRLRGFGFRQTSEEPQFDNFGGSSIQCFELDSQQYRYDEFGYWTEPAEQLPAKAGLVTFREILKRCGLENTLSYSLPDRKGGIVNARVAFFWAIVPSAFGQAYTISTFAGGPTPVNVAGISASLSVGVPQYLSADPAGNVFYADHNTILRGDAVSGIVTLVAGNGISGFSGDGGPATGAQLWGPTALAVDSSGTLYICDTLNNRVRKVANGVISTVAGNGTQGYSGDGGPATSAELSGPDGIAVDSAGNLYVSDGGNNVVRRISNRPPAPNCIPRWDPR
jgi:hypothetical protein